VFHTRAALRKLAASRPVSLFCDLHGHSRRFNVFAYGCERTYGRGSDPAARLGQRVFPHLLWRASPAAGKTGQAAPPPLLDADISVEAKLAKEPESSDEERSARPAAAAEASPLGRFSFGQCTFGVHPSKSGTARVVGWREVGVANTLTVEASFMGAGDSSVITRRFRAARRWRRRKQAASKAWFAGARAAAQTGPGRPEGFGDPAPRGVEATAAAGARECAPPPDGLAAAGTAARHDSRWAVLLSAEPGLLEAAERPEIVPSTASGAGGSGGAALAAGWGDVGLDGGGDAGAAATAGIGRRMPPPWSPIMPSPALSLPQLDASANAPQFFTASDLARQGRDVCLALVRYLGLQEELREEVERARGGGKAAAEAGSRDWQEEAGKEADSDAESDAESDGSGSMRDGVQEDDGRAESDGPGEGGDGGESSDDESVAYSGVESVAPPGAPAPAHPASEPAPADAVASGSLPARRRRRLSSSKGRGTKREAKASSRRRSRGHAGGGARGAPPSPEQLSKAVAAIVSPPGAESDPAGECMRGLLSEMLGAGSPGVDVGASAAALGAILSGVGDGGEEEEDDGSASDPSGDNLDEDEASRLALVRELVRARSEEAAEEAAAASREDGPGDRGRAGSAAEDGSGTGGKSSSEWALVDRGKRAERRRRLAAAGRETGRLVGDGAAPGSAAGPGGPALPRRGAQADPAARAQSVEWKKAKAARRRARKRGRGLGRLLRPTAGMEAARALAEPAEHGGAGSVRSRMSSADAASNPSTPGARAGAQQWKGRAERSLAAFVARSAKARSPPPGLGALSLVGAPDSDDGGSAGGGATPGATSRRSTPGRSAASSLPGSRLDRRARPTGAPAASPPPLRSVGSGSARRIVPGSPVAASESQRLPARLRVPARPGSPGRPSARRPGQQPRPGARGGPSFLDRLFREAEAQQTGARERAGAGHHVPAQGAGSGPGAGRPPRPGARRGSASGAVPSASSVPLSPLLSAAVPAAIWGGGDGDAPGPRQAARGLAAYGAQSVATPSRRRLAGGSGGSFERRLRAAVSSPTLQDASPPPLGRVVTRTLGPEGRPAAARGWGASVQAQGCRTLAGDALDAELGGVPGVRRAAAKRPGRASPPDALGRSSPGDGSARQTSLASLGARALGPVPGGAGWQ